VAGAEPERLIQEALELSKILGASARHSENGHATRTAAAERPPAEIVNLPIAIGNRKLPMQLPIAIYKSQSEGATW
jgi:hypothetical protein